MAVLFPPRSQPAGAVAFYSLGAITVDDRRVGIYNLGTATVRQSTLSGNSARSDGGGNYNGASGTLTIDVSVVLNDLALLGANLYNRGKATLDDSTVCVTGP
jgi:hypothetical protein